MVKNYSRRKSLLAILTVTGMVLLCACGSKSSGAFVEPIQKETVDAENITLKIWAPTAEVEMVDQLVRNFDAVHEEYAIEFEITPQDLGDAIDHVNEAGDEMPDIFYIPSGGIPALVEKGTLLSLAGDDFYRLSADLPETAISAVSVNDTPYAVPFSPNSFFLYYNTDYFGADEVKSLDTMMAKDFGAGKYNFTTCLTDSWYLEMFFLGNGCNLFGEDGRDPSICTFDSAAGVAAANYAINLANNPKYIDNSEDGYREFMAGNVGACTTGAWATPELREALGEKLSAAPLPVANIGGSDVQLSNFIDFKTIAVSNKSAYPEAAKQLAIYLANKDSSLRRYKMYGDIPVLQNLAENASITSDYAAAALNEQANYSTNQPNIPQMDNYWVPMMEFGQAIVDGEIDSSNVADRLGALVAKITTEVEASEDSESEAEETTEEAEETDTEKAKDESDTEADEEVSNSDETDNE